MSSYHFKPFYIFLLYFKSANPSHRDVLFIEANIRDGILTP